VAKRGVTHGIGYEGYLRMRNIPRDQNSSETDLEKILDVAVAVASVLRIQLSSLFSPRKAMSCRPCRYTMEAFMCSPPDPNPSATGTVASLCEIGRIAQVPEANRPSFVRLLDIAIKWAFKESFESAGKNISAGALSKDFFNLLFERPKRFALPWKDCTANTLRPKKPHDRWRHRFSSAKRCGFGQSLTSWSRSVLSLSR
jgi:hypothetical protein